MGGVSGYLRVSGKGNETYNTFGHERVGGDGLLFRDVQFTLKIGI